MKTTDPKARAVQAHELAPHKLAMNLPKLIENYGSEDKCHAYLEELRWPDGVRCPRCGFAKISRIYERKQYNCESCHYQFSVRVGTVFEGSHLPLWKWFIATYMMIESRKGMSANQLKRTLGVGYKTAWFLCHRIRWAMGESSEEKLTGKVEVDETYVGGKARYNRAMSNKTMVLGAIERNGRVVFRVEGKKSHADKETLRRFVKEVVDDDAEAIYTDQWWDYKGIGDENTRHETVNHSKDEWVRGEVSTQSIENVWSLLDRSIMGSFHQISTKHLPAYLDEIQFRFNNRENPFLFRDCLLRMIDTEALQYAELIKK